MQEIDALPDDLFARMSLLETLGLKGNRLILLPRSIGALRSLVSLFLSDNQLRTLPREIGGCKRMRKCTFVAELQI